MKLILTSQPSTNRQTNQQADMRVLREVTLTYINMGQSIIVAITRYIQNTAIIGDQLLAYYFTWTGGGGARPQPDIRSKGASHAPGAVQEGVP